MTIKPEQTKRDALLDVACQLFLERGYDEVSMQQIAENAGMTKAAPYYHFKNKDDLFIHVYMREMTRVHQVVEVELRQPGPFRDRLQRAIFGLVIESRSEVARLFSEFERFMTLTSEAELIGNVANQIDGMKQLLPYFIEAQERGEITRFPAERCCYLFLLIVMGHFQWMSVSKFQPANTLPMEEMSRELTDLFLEGVA